ncbi:MAG: glycosyltransferase family 9 protein [Silvanigrellaceae bacterium]|nr:glycosyltransferase family 9 protein [Silvanigrellaceae bacterium]
MNNNTSRIVISRTDNIGDVILTLPMAGVIKQYLPHSKVIFLGKNYTKEIINGSIFVDEFYSWDEVQGFGKKEIIDFFHNLHADVFIHVFPNYHIAKIAKKAQIKTRIGTSRRIYHLLFCNALVPLSRKNSPHLHESQLNLKLLQPLGIDQEFSLQTIPNFYGFKKFISLPDQIQSLLDQKKFNLILHPKSKGSAREWGLNNFAHFLSLLPKEKFNVFLTGTKEESVEIERTLLSSHPHVINLVGKLTLGELISFIKQADGLIAASTGPLHIASAVGKHALGLYPPLKSMIPDRWGPIGSHAQALVSLPKEGRFCKLSCKLNCLCMNRLSPENVVKVVDNWHKIQD